jgi:hypothetical protein
LKDFLTGFYCTDYATGWMIWGSFLGRATNFSVLENIQTCFGTHPASESMGTRVLNPGVKKQWHETEHSYPMLRLRMSGDIPPLPLYAFMEQTRTTLLLPYPGIVQY